MSFNASQPHIFTANWTSANPYGGGGTFSYEKGAIVSDPQVLVMLNALGAPIVNTVAGSGV